MFAAETIQGRKLFKGENYMMKYGIHSKIFSTGLWHFFYYLNTFKCIFILKHNFVVKTNQIWPVQPSRIKIDIPPPPIHTESFD